MDLSLFGGKNKEEAENIDIQLLFKMQFNQHAYDLK